MCLIFHSVSSLIALHPLMRQSFISILVCGLHVLLNDLTHLYLMFIQKTKKVRGLLVTAGLTWLTLFWAVIVSVVTSLASIEVGHVDSFASADRLLFGLN